MSETPSARRRRGRNAYYRGGYANELNPYKDASYACDWRQGWDEEVAIDEVRQAEEADTRMRLALPIETAIDMADCSEGVREILRRITEHVGME